MRHLPLPPARRRAPGQPPPLPERRHGAQARIGALVRQHDATERPFDPEAPREHYAGRHHFAVNGGDWRVVDIQGNLTGPIFHSKAEAVRHAKHMFSVTTGGDARQKVQRYEGGSADDPGMWVTVERIDDEDMRENASTMPLGTQVAKAILTGDIDRARRIQGSRTTWTAGEARAIAAACDQANEKYGSQLSLEDFMGRPQSPYLRGPRMTAEERELDALRLLLRSRGYDPADAERLHAEGMGEEELSHRLRTAPTGVGSLEYTHGLKRSRHPLAEHIYEPNASEAGSYVVTIRRPSKKVAVFPTLEEAKASVPGSGRWSVTADDGESAIEWWSKSTDASIRFMEGGAVPNARRAAEPDEDAATELLLYIENESDLSPQGPSGQGREIAKNLMRKMAKGKYDHALAPKLWLYLVESGGKRYAKEFGDGERSWTTMFTPATRDVVAQALADQFRDAVAAGDYDGLDYRTGAR